jgi:hypothetical protein
LFCEGIFSTAFVEKGDDDFCFWVHGWFFSFIFPKSMRRP